MGIVLLWAILAHGYMIIFFNIDETPRGGVLKSWIYMISTKLGCCCE